MVQKLRPFYWRGQFSPLVELHQEGSAPAAWHSRLVFYWNTINHAFTEHNLYFSGSVEKLGGSSLSTPSLLIPPPSCPPPSPFLSLLLPFLFQLPEMLVQEPLTIRDCTLGVFLSPSKVNFKTFSISYWYTYVQVRVLWEKYGLVCLRLKYKHLVKRLASKVCRPDISKEAEFETYDSCDIISRPGRSQGLLYKQPCHSIIN